MGRRAGLRVLEGFRPRGRLVGVAVLVAVLVGAVGLASAAAADFHGSITAGGSPVGVTLSSGDAGYLTFTGSAGERVFVKASTGTLSGTGIYAVSLLDPGLTEIGSTGGFVFTNQTKFIDATTLSSAGTYTIKVSVSRTGFRGDLGTRMLSWGEEILRCHVETEEVPRGVA